MRRRSLIQLIGLLLLWSPMARTQRNSKNAKIGVLWSAGSADEERCIAHKKIAFKASPKKS
jgi:hypothetical protein